MKKRYITLTAFLVACALLFTSCAARLIVSPSPSPTIAPTQPQQPSPTLTQPSSPAITTPDVIPSATPNTEDALNALLPVMDSVLRALNPRIPYNVQSNEFVWSVLYLMGVNWGYTASSVVVRADGTTIVPLETMMEFAQAAFDVIESLPPVPESFAQSISLDQSGVYLLSPSDIGNTIAKLDRYQTQEDGQTVAVVSLYDMEGNALVSADFTLLINKNSAAYPYSITGAVLSDNQPVDVRWQAVDPNSPIHADLNTDAAEEQIILHIDENDEVNLEFIINGQTYIESIGCLFDVSCYIGDALADDGQKELYVIGDVASDDYVTRIYTVRDGKVRATEIWGIVELVNGSGEVSVRTTIDVLGTYNASCRYLLDNEAYAFTLASPYTVLLNAESWDYRKLTLKAELPAKQIQNEEETSILLPAGTELILLETDAESYVCLMQKDGSLVWLDIVWQQDYWAMWIENKPEDEWFDGLMYAG